MKLLTVILFSTLIYPSPFIPARAKRADAVYNVSAEVKVLVAKSSHLHVQLNKMYS